MKKLILVLLFGVFANQNGFAGEMNELSLAFAESVEKYIEDNQVWISERGDSIEQMVATGPSKIVSVKKGLSNNQPIVTIQGQFDITSYNHEKNSLSTHSSTCSGTYDGDSAWEEIYFSCD